MNGLSKNRTLLILAAGFVAMTAFVLASSLKYRIGFPLDDAWIHQTYARNLALRGEFSFIPGVPSAGSTAPLWTILLVPGQWLGGGSSILFFAFFLGLLSLGLMGYIGEKLFREMALSGSLPIGKSPHAIPVAGLILVTEWHLVWAASSGMETTLFNAVILLILYLAWKGRMPAFWLGSLIGLSIWVRPDGITLLGPAAMMLFFQEQTWKRRLLRTGYLLIGLTLPLAGYLFFNASLSGSLWPSTFYAKQAEYASLWNESLFLRFFRLARLPLVGVGVLLLPGFIYQAYETIRRRKVNHAALFLWWFGYTALYAYRLPVDYQHGRYLIPAMPVFLLLGLSGTLDGFGRWKFTHRARRLAGFAGKAMLVLVAVAFLGVGAQAYATDVAIIESEMVDTALWLRGHTLPADLLAVHDIGAVGYFGGRQIIDLAGLVTPEVIPFIQNEEQTADYLDARGVTYLMTFPDWYQSLPDGKAIVFQSGGAYSIAEGGTNMTVFRWKD